MRTCLLVAAVISGCGEDPCFLLCKAHNRYQAELDFGADLVRQRIAERRASE